MKTKHRSLSQITCDYTRLFGSLNILILFSCPNRIMTFIANCCSFKVFIQLIRDQIVYDYTGIFYSPGYHFTKVLRAPFLIQSIPV